MEKVIHSKGTILRYDSGPTALMMVTNHRENHGGLQIRYWGIQCMGGFVGRYCYQVQPATDKDKQIWEDMSKWRKNTVVREVSEDEL